eukprot:scaffold3046_cov105-Cylindrotheca_fusiformis.AAC.3
MASFYPDHPLGLPPQHEGAEGNSLDGQSLILNHDDNTISSINTDYHSRQMRALGMDPDIPNPGDSPVKEYAPPPRPAAKAKNNQYTQPKKSKSKSKSPSVKKLKHPRNGDYYDDETSSCLPIWIIDAPFWLKMVIVTSVALLLGAMVLIGVAATLEVQNRDEEKRAPSPASPPGYLKPTPGDGFGDLSPPTQAPVVNIEPWEPRRTDTTVSFFVVAGRFPQETLDTLPEELQALPNIDGNTVLFHLGDWNSPSATECDEASFQDNAILFQQSSLPVYFVVGDNEFNDCPNPREAYSFWYDYLLEFETLHWPPPSDWSISRDVSDYSENFAYVYRNVLVIGINLVGGEKHDEREWEDRHEADLNWIQSNFASNEGDFELMVILAHADPEIQSNEDFFNSFYDLVGSDFSDTQVVYIHRSLGTEKWGYEGNYNRLENLIVGVVEGTVWPPMLVTIDTAAGLVDFDQEQWYIQYKEAGMV